MRGTMMDFPLTLEAILERAGKFFGMVEIVSRRPDKSLYRTTYGEVYRRARALAEALTAAGLKRGDRVATLMWNHAWHLETYFGVPVAGGIVHTLNLRLHAGDLEFIVNDAQDRFLIVDDVLLPLYEKFKDKVKFERVFVVPFGQKFTAEDAEGAEGDKLETRKQKAEGGKMQIGGEDPEDKAARMAALRYESYEELLAGAKGNFAYPQMGENEAAAMCYTSGTTGKPKGVLYSHRALVLHSFGIALTDSMGLAQRDTCLPVVPMFHANAWGLPYACTMLGIKQVFPGPHLDAESVLDLFEGEKVTFSAGVPTVWMAVLDALEKNPGRWKLQPGLRMIVGGAAAPEAMIRRFDQLGLQVCHSWGMTEMTPAGTTSKLKSYMRDWPEDARYAIRAKQGLPFPFVEVRAMHEQGPGEKVVPWDGSTLGELQVRGPWIASSYYNLPEERDKWTEDGWFRTGDVVSIDAEGYVKIADRTKDLIKSGGEWISSVDLENALMGHPAVREAAVIALPHPKWIERPLAVVVLKDGVRVSEEELRAHLAAKFSKWQLPDAIVFASEIPRTSTGKFMKTKMRDQYANWKWE